MPCPSSSYASFHICFARSVVCCAVSKIIALIDVLTWIFGPVFSASAQMMSFVGHSRMIVTKKCHSWNDIYLYIHIYMDIYGNLHNKSRISSISCVFCFSYIDKISYSPLFDRRLGTRGRHLRRCQIIMIIPCIVPFIREKCWDFSATPSKLDRNEKKSVKRVWMTHRHICVLIFPNTWFSAIYIYIVCISQILKANKVILNSKQRITILWFYNWYERSAWKIPAMTNWLNICCGEGPIFIAVLTNRTHKQTSYHD